MGVCILLLFLYFTTTSSASIEFTLRKKIPTLQDHLRLLEESPPTVEQIANTPIFDFKLANFKNSQYVGQLFIGSNQQPLNVVFDTGSHFLVIPNASLSDQFDNVYDCSSSTTCKSYEDKHIVLRYGSGNGYGYVAEDQIGFGIATIAVNTTFVLSTELGGLPSEFHADGILGLRTIKNLSTYYVYPNADTICRTNYSLIDNLYAQGVIKKRQFSFFLNNVDRLVSEELGADFTLGGYNRKYAKSNFTFLKVVHENYWAIQTTGFNIGGINIQLSKHGIKTIIDTGTSVITIPKQLFKTIAPIIAETAGCDSIRGLMCVCSNGPCNIDPDDFPTIVIEFDGMKAILPGRTYALNLDGYNVLEIIGLDMSEHFLILGDPFMRQYLTLFDADDDTLGLAESINFVKPVRSWKGMLLFVLAITLLTSLLIGFCLFKRHRRREDDNVRLLNANNEQGITMTHIQPSAVA